MNPLEWVKQWAGGNQLAQSVKHGADLLMGKTEFINPNAGNFGPPIDKIVKGTLFGEIGNRPGKQYLEAQTILNTVRNRMKGGKSLHEIITQPNQYQAYNGREYHRFIQGSTTPVDEAKVKAIDKAYEEFMSGKLENNIGDYQFYHHSPTGIRATKSWQVGGPLAL